MGTKALLKMDGYAFAASTAVVPIVGAEFPNVARAMPIAFIKHQDSYVPIALMSLGDQCNVFVGPGGRWLGGYIPSALRTYPFRLLASQGGSEWTLCVDEASPAIVEIGGEAQPLFGADGHISTAISEVLNVLKGIERNRVTTTTAVAVLAQCDILRPWNAKLQAGDGLRSLAGLYCVDEAALNALADETFLAARKAQAIGLAYMQLFSMGQLGVLEQRARLHDQASQGTAQPAGLYGMSTDDILQF